jgi:hypothetical protein
MVFGQIEVLFRLLLCLNYATEVNRHAGKHLSLGGAFQVALTQAHIRVAFGVFASGMTLWFMGVLSGDARFCSSVCAKVSRAFTIN